MKKVVLLLICLMMVFALAACPKGKPDSLEITKPNQLTYIAGTEKIDLTGGKVGVKYTDGKIHDEVNLDHADVTISEYSLAIVGTVNIEVKYKDLKGSFDVEVVSDEGIESISVSTRPLKTSYGQFAKAANVEKRGGELTVKFSDGKPDAKVPFSDPAVSIHKIDYSSLKITVLYKGLSAEYAFTINESEMAYVTFTKLPTRTTYRANAGKIDVDLRGGEVTVEIGGKNAGTKSLDTWGRIKITDIDTDLGFISFARDLTDFAGSEKYTVEGYLDIDVVDTWVEEVEIKQIPTAKIDPVTKLNGYNLAGGVATLTYSDGTKKDANLPDNRFIMDEFLFDENSIMEAHVVLRYEDEVATADEINCTIDTLIKEDGHTDNTRFEYYLWVLPSSTNAKGELSIWSTITEFSARQKEIAEDGFNEWIALSDAQRTELGAAGKHVVSLKFYTDRYDVYYKGFDELDAIMETYRDSDYRTTAGGKVEEALIAKAGELKSLADDFFDKYDDDTDEDIAAIQNFVLYTNTQRYVDPATGEMVEKEITVVLKDNLANTYNYCKNNLEPLLAVADNAIENAKTLLTMFESSFDDATMLQLDTSKKIRDLYVEGATEDQKDPLAKAIEAIYAFINHEDRRLAADRTAEDDTVVADPRLPTSSRLSSYILTGDKWFPNALDIIYAYYYNPAQRKVYNDLYEKADADWTLTDIDLEGNRYVSPHHNTEIYWLIQDGIVSELIREVSDFVTSPMQSLSVRDNVRFLNAYAEYERIMEKLDEYQYEYTVEILYAHRSVAYIDPNAIPSAKAQFTKYGKTATAGFKSNQLEHWLGTIKNYYDEVLKQYYGELIEGDNFKTFFPKYSTFFSKWTSSSLTNYNPYPVGNEEFDREFEEIFAHFMDSKKFTFAERGAFLSEIDRSIARSLQIDSDKSNYSATFLGMMLESYLRSRLVSSEFELHLDIMKAYTMLSLMAYEGVSMENLTAFRTMMVSVNAGKRAAGVTSPEFNKYSEKLLSICQSSHTSLAGIGTKEKDIIDNIYLAMDTLNVYAMLNIDVYGFMFLSYYDELNTALDTWYNTGKKEEDLDKFTIGEEFSVGSQLRLIKEGYRKHYSAKIGDNVVWLFHVGKSYVKGITNPPAYATTANFNSDIENMLEEFNSFTDAYKKFNYINAAIDVMANVLIAYNKNYEIPDAENQFFTIYCFQNYYFWLMIDAMLNPESRETFGYYSDAEIANDPVKLGKRQRYDKMMDEVIEAFFAFMSLSTEEYDEIVEDTGFTSDLILFEGKNIEDFYLWMVQNYEGLMEDYSHLVPDAD